MIHAELYLSIISSAARTLLHTIHQLRWPGKLI